MPSWMGEVAAFAQILTHEGILKAIQEQVRFARARFGQYDVIDFVAVLIGYALSGEPILLAFYERLLPFAEPFMALFGRNQLPHRSTLSRFLAALDQTPVEALRALSRGSAGSQTVSFSWWRVRPNRRAVDRGRCGWDPTSCPPTGTSTDGVAARSPSSFRSGLCSRVSGAQAGRSGARAYLDPFLRVTTK